MSLEKDNAHFIFSVESTGALPARVLVLEAIRVLRDKAAAALAAAGGPAARGADDIPVMAPAAAAAHSAAAMRSPGEEDD